MSQWRRQRKQFSGFSWLTNKDRCGLVFMDFVKIASALPAAVKIAIEFLLISWDAIEFFSQLGILFWFVVYGYDGIGCV
jgi:hypothetical protein